MRWLLLLTSLYLVQLTTNAQAQQVSAKVTLCEHEYTVTGDVSGKTYTIKVTLDGDSVRTIKIKKKKKDSRDTFKTALSDSLHQNNLFGGTCNTDYGLIYDFATRFTEKAMTTWFPEPGIDETITIPMDENRAFHLEQGKFDKKYQLTFATQPPATVILVAYNYHDFKYKIDWHQTANIPEIKKNIDKFLNCYNALPSSVKPTLYLLQTSETEYSIVESEDNETATETLTHIPKKAVATLLGDPRGLDVDHVYHMAYTLNFISVPAPASKKANNDPKFKEHN